jgi:signal transduction histidine kinase
MTNKIKQNIHLLIALFSFLLLIVIIDFNTSSPDKIIQLSEKALHQKEKKVKEQLIQFQEYLKTKNPKELFELHNQNFINLFNEEGIVYLVYQNDSLIYWSDNSPSVEEYMKEVCLDNSVAKLKNGYYEIIKEDSGLGNMYAIYGLVLLKHQFSYQNTYLKNTFFKDYYLPDDTEVLEKGEENYYELKNSDGKPLIHLKFSKDKYRIYTIINWLSIVFYFTTLVFFFFFLKQVIWKIKTNRSFKFLILLITVVIIRLLLIHFRIPEAIYSTDLYNALIFGDAESTWFGYIGDILIHSVLICWFSFIIYSEFGNLSFSKKQTRITFLALGVIGLTLFLFFIQHLTKSAVINSSVTLQITQLFKLNLISYLVFTSILLLYISFFIGSLVLINQLIKSFVIKTKTYYILIVLCCLIFLAVLPFNNFNCLLWMLSLLIYLIIIKSKFDELSFLNSIIIAILFSIIISYQFYYYNEEKELALNSSIAEKIAEREDAIAENLYSDLRKNLLEDKKILELINSNPVPSQEIEKRIRQVYLGGYWERYQVNFSVFDSLCRPLILVANPLFENNSYFDELIKNDGLPTTSEDFYFLNKQGEDIKYIGRIDLSNNKIKYKKPILIYFEFSPRNQNQLTGFPELLLDQTNYSSKSINEISYAIYKNNQLLNLNGKINYPKNLFVTPNHSGQFIQTKINNVHHLIYFRDNEIAVVISNEKNKLKDWFTSNSYFFFIISLLVWLIFLLKEWRIFHLSKTNSSIRLRIQLLIVSIVLFFLISLSTATFIFIENQFKNKNTETLIDKLNLTENSFKTLINEENSLKPLMKDYFSWQIKKLASLHATDINLFDSKGNLYTSSQPRLFNEGIISKKMNPDAYRQLKGEDSKPVLIKDNIGNMNFYSVFQPIQNNDGKLLAYINLPYFAKQADLENEWNLYIVAIINIYVILFSLSIVASLLISNFITRPLQIIQEKFSTIKIGKHNDPITWNRNDEIGKLVTEYNNMIMQLEKNVIQLAKSEREGAWKEMAKQVAHEIKNPLTPMKLNIQHLERSLDVEPDELKSRIKKLAKMLIEQIDSLALIANEFSSFAKMPLPELQPHVIEELIKNSVQLFSANDSLSIHFINYEKQNLKANIDKDQFCRVLYNLLKNAQQAIPLEKEGIITIQLKKQNEEILISITDNGIGIPDELKDKIFYPNFSTKTEGMGLGLAMVKNIIESFNGKIYFETNFQIGTTFNITLPLVL